MIDKTKLTLGMATFDDFHGVYFTVHAAIMYHGEHINEIVIVDNNPDSKHGKATAAFAANLPHIVRYVPYTEKQGTANTRNKVIATALSPNVVVCDPHILFPNGSIKAVRDYFNANPNTKNLIQGPLLYDNHIQVSTHFNDVWGAEMWGQWDTDKDAYERGEPFEIPAQGLGVFATRKDCWLGFNPDFRGFGGEEHYIHIKYRQNGRKTICVPEFLWVHRFGRPDGAPYPLKKYDKVHNYLVGFKELGLDPEPIRQHFVGTGALSQLEWNLLEKGETPGNLSGCGCEGDKFPTLADWFTYIRNQPSDLNEHAETLRAYAKGHSVVDYGHRPNVSSVALAYGEPAKYTMLHPNEPREWKSLSKYLKNSNPELVIVKQYIPNIPPCDVLFLDTLHTADYIDKFLTENAVNVGKFILIHDSVIYGEKGEDGGPGIMEGVRRFVRQNRRWSVYEHYHNNYGLVILCGDDSYKPKLPSKLRQASNFAKAIASHVADGSQKVSLELYEQRLIQCDECPQRVNDRCAECGCFIETKASWKEQICPQGKWQ